MLLPGCIRPCCIESRQASASRDHEAQEVRHGSSFHCSQTHLRLWHNLIQRQQGHLAAPPAQDGQHWEGQTARGRASWDLCCITVQLALS